MVNSAEQLRPSAPGSIEELRIIATILLVAFHVIGQPDSGLRVAEGHPARFLVDLGASFRMPAFAFVAGFIYCMRPPQRGHMRAFLRGKLRRIAVPGIIAAALFASVAYINGTRFGLPPQDLWELLVFPFAHFWFLQAILLIFVIVGLADIALDHRGHWPLFAAALILALWPPPVPRLFALPHALQLAPFFIFGMAIYRSWPWVTAHSRILIFAATCAALLAFGAAFHDYMLAGISPEKGIASSLLLGMSLSMLILLCWPHHPNARRVGQFSFTIYLYHVFATAGTRTWLKNLGVDELAIHILLGVTAGLLAPIVLHLIVSRLPLAGELMLGVRAKLASRPAPRHVDAAPPLQRPSRSAVELRGGR